MKNEVSRKPTTSSYPALPMWHCEADNDTPSKEETESIDGIFYENYALNLRVIFAI
jgi:hypothetical protein